MRDGDARRAIAWAERWRAGSLQLRPARPPDDSALAAALAELRRIADVAFEGSGCSISRFTMVGAANIAGSYLGARMAVAKGSRFVRVVFMVVVGGLIGLILGGLAAIFWEPAARRFAT